VLAPPADCAEQLARGEVQVGLIPSIEYLRRNVNYDLGSGRIEGLAPFYRLAYEAGLAPRLSQLQFLPEPPSPGEVYLNVIL